jgi:hypothetical protein
VHRRYQRFCSLAATGQLGGPEMSELNAHVANCRSCREYLESVTRISVQLPLLSGANEVAANPPEGMRARFLARLATEGREPSLPEPLVFQRMGPPPLSEKEKQRQDRAPRSSTRTGGTWRAPAAAAVVVVAAASFYFGKHTRGSREHVVRSVPAGTLAPAAPQAADAPDRLHLLEEQKLTLQTELGDLRQRLSAAASEQDSLRQRLAAATERRSQQTQAPTQTAEKARPDHQETPVQVAQLESEIDRLNQQLHDSQEKLSSQQHMTLQLSDKLQLTEVDLQKERDLKSARSEMGDLVAARNLHIVDVYDADPSGKQQRAFGRVFYIENKSLVFYAYDLNNSRQFKANVVFHVWGGKAGVQEVTHSLGILHKDDAGQERWAMTFDDSKVLSQINSVFVTAESPNKPSDSPHGRKVLYAYFGGEPNHP